MCKLPCRNCQQEINFVYRYGAHVTHRLKRSTHKANQKLIHHNTNFKKQGRNSQQNFEKQQIAYAATLQTTAVTGVYLSY